MRLKNLILILRWLAVLLILRVLISILANYPDYFPPNFDSLFLLGRETSFQGAYCIAFYIHIFMGPIVLINGLILLSETVRNRNRGLHRFLGRFQVVVLLFLLFPSSIVMSQYAFGGWEAGLSFILLSVSMVACAIVGVVYAKKHRYHRHRDWMLRSYVLLCSAVALRLISGGIGLFEIANVEQAYILAAWSSWLILLAITEIVLRWWPLGLRG